MSYALVSITPATILPVDLATAKLFMRSNTSIEDGVITDLVAAAAALWELQSGYTPTATTYELRLDAIRGRELYLPRRPVTSVGTVTYLDPSGVWQPLTGYSVDLGSTPARIVFPTTLPPLHPTMRPRIKVQFTSGHTTAAAVPRAITTSISRLATHWFKSRDLGEAAPEVPANWQWAVDSYRLALTGDVWGQRFDDLRTHAGYGLEIAGLPYG